MFCDAICFETALLTVAPPIMLVGAAALVLAHVSVFTTCAVVRCKQLTCNCQSRWVDWHSTLGCSELDGVAYLSSTVDGLDEAVSELLPPLAAAGHPTEPEALLRVLQKVWAEAAALIGSPARAAAASFPNDILP